MKCIDEKDATGAWAEQSVRRMDGDGKDLMERRNAMDAGCMDRVGRPEVWNEMNRIAGAVEDRSVNVQGGQLDG